jgi:hypothetical protein
MYVDHDFYQIQIMYMLLQSNMVVQYSLFNCKLEYFTWSVFPTYALDIQ